METSQSTFTVNNVDKNLSGKSDEREVKLCKSWFFTLHPSFFILWKLSFRTAKHKLWPPQRPCFTVSNISFGTTKRYLWRSETIPLANSSFVNRPITIQYSYNHLSVNALRKASKIALFSPKEQFVQKDALNLGPKFEYYLTKFRSPEFEIRVCRAWVFVMPNIRRTL